MIRISQHLCHHGCYGARYRLVAAQPTPMAFPQPGKSLKFTWPALDPRGGKARIPMSRGLEPATRIGERPIRADSVSARPRHADGVRHSRQTQVRKCLRARTAAEVMADRDRGDLLIARNGKGNRHALRCRAAPLADGRGRRDDRRICCVAASSSQGAREQDRTHVQIRLSTRRPYSHMIPCSQSSATTAGCVS